MDYDINPPREVSTDGVLTLDSMSDGSKQQTGAEAARKRFLQRKAWFSLEYTRQQSNRYQMALDEDYYDSIQWTTSEAAEIRNRGQDPVVYNEVAPTIDWLLGTERRMRRDFKVLARADKSPEAQHDAEIKTKLLKYLEDVNRAPWSRSMAFDDAMKAGIGWIEIGIREDATKEPIYKRHESWRNILYDSLGAKESPDPRNWRYMFRFKEVDLDIAIAWFPGKRKELERAASQFEDAHHHRSDDWLNGYPEYGVLGDSRMPARWIQYDAQAWILNPRRRVLLIEAWSYEPRMVSSGTNPHLVDRAKMSMMCAVMTEFDTLIESWSPFAHETFPFVPVWAYRRKKDGAPYSPIRRVRGPQDSLNKRMSKAQFLLSVNQMRIEKSAIDDEEMDIEELRGEAAAPDGVLVFADGALSGNKVQTREHLDLAQGHLALAERDVNAIRNVSGITGDSRGIQTGAQSGKAIIAKQDQGGLVTAALFDNLMFSHQIEGEIELSLIEQYYTDPKIFSVTGDRYKLDYYEINQIDPATGQKLNDVTARHAQFVIGEAPWRQSMAEAAFESAMNLLGQLAPVAPNVVVAIIDLVFEWADLPNKETILQRVRQATGQPDPDKGPTPEQKQAQEEQKRLAQAQMEAMLAKLQAEVAEAQARGEKVSAEAIAHSLAAMKSAAEAAMGLTTAPGIAPMADELLKSAGFVDKSAQEPVIDAQAQVQPQPPMPSQGQPAPNGVPPSQE